MPYDNAASGEQSAVVAQLAAHDPVMWRATWSIHHFANDTGEIARALEAGADVRQFADKLTDVIEQEGNLLMFGGASVLWQCLMGNGVTTAGQNLAFFNNANAAIGVGDSTTAAAGTQNDLQAATNKLRKGMDATYPQHTDGTTSGNATITFRSTFGPSEANFAWQEWGVFNSASAGVGRMLNRKVENNGTKATGTSTFTVQLTLA